MNQKQKQVNKKLLDEERQVIKELRKCYTESLNEVKHKIIILSQNKDMLSKIYQRKYQQVLYDQLSETLKLLDSGKINSIEDFLNKTAETSFIGTLYEFNNDVPLLVPVDNKAIAAIISKKVNDFNFSQRLHGDTQELTKITVKEISRGFSTGMSYQDMARNISNLFTRDFNNAYRIAQTEGHRVSQETAFDTARKFKEKGADIIKQWDSTLDKKTRPHHVQLDGQIRELDDPFEIAGHSAMYPGAFGIPSEDIRCRCVMIKRARWALDSDETKFDGENNRIVKIKAKRYEEFKNKYQTVMKQQSDGSKEVVGAEFNDEGFTRGKLSKIPSPYSKRIVEITDRYFKKDKSKVPEIKIVPDGQEKTFKKYTDEEIMNFANENEVILDKYVSKKSKWSGRIRIEKNKSYKDWSCDIVVSEETSPMVILHEQLHARSASYIQKEKYRDFRTIEEASVQLLTQEISQLEDIEIISSAYDELADKLRELNDIAGLYDNHLDFAVQLHSQNLLERNDWLEQKAYDKLMVEGNIDKLMKFNEIMNVMRMETPPWKLKK